MFPFCVSYEQTLSFSVTFIDFRSTCMLNKQAAYQCLLIIQILRWFLFVSLSLWMLATQSLMKPATLSSSAFLRKPLSRSYRRMPTGQRVDRPLHTVLKTESSILARLLSLLKAQSQWGRALFELFFSSFSNFSFRTSLFELLFSSFSSRTSQASNSCRSKSQIRLTKGPLVLVIQNFVLNNGLIRVWENLPFFLRVHIVCTAHARCTKTFRPKFFSQKPQLCSILFQWQHTLSNHRTSNGTTMDAITSQCPNASALSSHLNRFINLHPFDRPKQFSLNSFA